MCSQAQLHESAQEQRQCSKNPNFRRQKQPIIIRNFSVVVYIFYQTLSYSKLLAY